MMTAHDVSDVRSVPKFALTQFTVDEFRDFWPKLERTLDAVPHTWRHWTKEYIYESIETNNVQVWGLGPPGKATLVAFTTVNMFPAVKVLTVVWAAGRFDDEMLPIIDAALTNFAQLNSCDEIEIRGRQGWDRKLKRIGFRCEARMWTRRVRTSSKLN